eukprot:1644602-Rhodomonas_salina.2
MRPGQGCRSTSTQIPGNYYRRTEQSLPVTRTEPSPITYSGYLATSTEVLVAAGSGSWKQGWERECLTTTRTLMMRTTA